MAIQPFLAMTAAEIRKKSRFPMNTAWMACHFSPYGTGLSNLPPFLPPGSLLILNDRTPIHGHDPELIAGQLEQCLQQFDCYGLLLDFQRSDCPETAMLTKRLTAALAFPLGVTELYAAECSCAVFLPPVPPSTALADHLAPWKSREIWLELALDGEYINLTEHGSEAFPFPCSHHDDQGFWDTDLHCHYKINLEEDAAKFTLWRTMEDLDLLLTDAERLGVTNAVGLYQELHSVME